MFVSRDDYLLACGCHVELNPIRAKIAENPKEYKWSSCNVYAYGRKTEWPTSILFIMKWF
jgi:putative transposase